MQTHPTKGAAKIGGAELERKATQLRLTGAPYERIAAELGVSVGGAYKAVQRALAKTRAAAMEAAEELRDIERRNLLAMRTAISPQVEAGHLGAIATGVKISESLRKLDGLDAPPRAPVDEEGRTVLNVTLDLGAETHARLAAIDAGD